MIKKLNKKQTKIKQKTNINQTKIKQKTNKNQTKTKKYVGGSLRSGFKMSQHVAAPMKNTGSAAPIKRTGSAAPIKRTGSTTSTISTTSKGSAAQITSTEPTAPIKRTGSTTSTTSTASSGSAAPITNTGTAPKPKAWQKVAAYFQTLGRTTQDVAASIGLTAGKTRKAAASAKTNSEAKDLLKEFFHPNKSRLVNADKPINFLGNAIGKERETKYLTERLQKIKALKNRMAILENSQADPKSNAFTQANAEKKQLGDYLESKQSIKKFQAGQLEQLTTGVKKSPFSISNLSSLEEKLQARLNRLPLSPVTSPSASVTSPSASVTSPSASVTSPSPSPSASVTSPSPSATVTSPSASVTSPSVNSPPTLYPRINRAPAISRAQKPYHLLSENQKRARNEEAGYMNLAP